MGQFNGSGTFNRSYSWVTDEANGVDIISSRQDTEDDGFASGLSNCICKDGQTTITADIPFSGNKITGLGAPVSGNDATTKTYVDTRFKSTVFADVTDDTKTVTLDLSGITTATDRDWAFPDAPGTFVGAAVTQTLLNKSLSASTSFIIDETDATKRVTFDLSGLTTAKTITLTVPNTDPLVDFQIVGTEATQTLENKVLLDPLFADSADPTKEVVFSMSGITPASIWAIAFPNEGGTMVLDTATQKLTHKSFGDSTDATKVLAFDLSALTTATTRTVDFQDADGLVVLGDAGQPYLADGKIGLGATALAAGVQLQALNVDTGDKYITLTSRANDATAEHIVFEKSRGGGTASIVANDDVIGSIEWKGFDGSDYVSAAQIIAEIDGSPSAGDMPARIRILLAAGGSTAEEIGRIINDGTILWGKTAVGFTSTGVEIGKAGSITVSRNAGIPAAFNRVTNDGTVVIIAQDGTTEGSISVSGTTVSFNAFSGGHWAQFIDNSTPSVLQGTIMDTIDEMSSWPGEDNEQLARVKISDAAGSRSVYGVFMDWSPDDDGTNPTGDMIVTAIGAFKVRIASGLTVARGDLIESNGDGCGRAQADDVMRSSTVAKVTANVIIETYADGSYTVPATLHCG